MTLVSVLITTTDLTKLENLFKNPILKMQLKWNFTFKV